MPISLGNIAILNIKNYRCVVNGISKNESTDLMQNAYLTEKGRRL